MDQPSLTGDQLIYEAEIYFTGVVDYGVSMVDLTSGKAAVPPAGARFDQTFEGVLHGPVLKGTISGTDYLLVRADGLFHLHLHARVTTDDGTNIAMSSEGVSIPVEGRERVQLRAAVSLLTASETYDWLNRQRLWAVGTLDPLRGQALVKAYAACGLSPVCC